MARVAIVGAGPAGATLAYLLARRGVGVTLLERQTDFEREFRGEVLMPSAIDAFGQMGLAAAVRSLPQVGLKRLEVYRGTRHLATFSMTMDPGLTIVSQPAMLEMLVGEAARFANFSFERGATVRDLLRENGRVSGLIADTLTGPRRIRADFVIGTDGRASVIRRRAGLHEERRPQAFDIVWFKVPLDGFLTGNAARVHVWPGHAVAAIRTYGDRLQIAWIIEKGTFGEIRRMGVDGWLEAMTSYVSDDFAAHLRANRATLTHPFLLDVICDRLAKWTAPGLLLLGDAAHPMSPVGGQGINIAIRDAIIAANHLCPPLAANGTASELDDAAARIQAERLPEVIRIQQFQQIGPRLFFEESWLFRIVMSRPTMALLGTRPARSLLAGRFNYFLNGAVPVRLDS